MPMRKRICSIILVLILMLSATAVPVSASTESDRIQRQIYRSYGYALATENKESMSGLCATLVGWQLVYLGINSYYVGCDGKDVFDTYRNMSVTDGGYVIHAYSAEDYTILEALNAITANGTQDAYNIAMGYQQTNTAAGSIYGHTNLIHAILDGMVYFVESDSYSVGGSYFTEGTPIVCTIAEYADLYSGWMVFDGAIEFGQLPYVCRCETIRTDICITLPNSAIIRSQPCSSAVDKGSKAVRVAEAGERFRVTNIVLNSEGEYWYEVEDEAVGYLRCVDARFVEAYLDGVTLEDPTLPGILSQGESFTLDGTVRHDGCSVSRVHGMICAADDPDTPVQNVLTQPQDSTLNLRSSEINRSLRFSSLEPGRYRYVIKATAYCPYVDETGTVQNVWDNIVLCDAEFVVKERGDSTDYGIITYDGNGGVSAVNQTVVETGCTAQLNTKVERPGYRFTGWSTKPDGYVTVSSKSHFKGDTTLYACWEEDSSNCSGWTMVDGSWRYYVDGVMQTGWVWVDGIHYYLRADGTVVTGWSRIGGQVYYFRSNGAVYKGTLQVGGLEYVFGRNGVLISSGNVDGNLHGSQ